MLKITAILPHTDGSLVVDDYIPLKFRSYRGVLPCPFLWHTGDLKTTLLEVTSERGTGVLRGATLTAFVGPTEEGIPPQYDQAETTDGLPVIDTAPFSSELLEEPIKLRIFRSAERLLVVFDLNTEPVRRIRTNRVGFFIDAFDQLCGIGFFGLSAPEMGCLLGQLG